MERDAAIREVLSKVTNIAQRQRLYAQLTGDSAENAGGLYVVWRRLSGDPDA